ncbi:MAG TPA: ABC transporter permease [Bacteroidales bacterium]|nr:ABC transporter permease [Bacteroidales bacterium]
MGKINLIIQREYLTRVRKKSFVIMTILGPILFAAFMIVPAWLATIQDTEEKVIAVVDQSGMFNNKIPDTDYLSFRYLDNANLDSLKKDFQQKGYYGILFIPKIVTYSPNSVELFSDKQPSMSIKMHIASALEKEIENKKLKAHNIENLDKILESVKTSVKINTIKITENGTEKRSSTGIAMAVGYAAGFLIYFFIFLFGAQVMRGVLEEKTNRIVEVMVSSVKPFQLMMGKIIGLALVGLTQFILWIVLTFGLVAAGQSILFPQLNKTETEKATSQQFFSSSVNQEDESQLSVASDDMDQIKDVLQSIKNINFGAMIGSFIFFFLGGYLLYASLFAAIGSAVDNETDTQQFMFPITIPLIIGIFVMLNTINNPEGSIAFWFSIIPFTSPIVMMVRIPFGVPYWQLALSMALLILTFIGTTWVAAKIYRTGILMYGKKVNYKELWKWLRY